MFSNIKAAIFTFDVVLVSAQRSRHQHLSGGRQAAVHPGGVGQEDPPLLRAAPGRPGDPAAGR